MSIAKKCDRCGKCYNRYNEVDNDKYPNGIMLLNIDKKQQFHSHTPLDLCSDCMNKLLAFLKKTDDVNG